MSTSEHWTVAARRANLFYVPPRPIPLAAHVDLDLLEQPRRPWRARRSEQKRPA